MTSRMESRKVSPPSEKNIEDLLGSIKPTPSPRFYQKFRDAPWNHETTHALLFHWKFFVITLGCLIIVSFFFIPPFRVIAKNWLKYFLPDRQDHIQIPLGDLNPQELFQYASLENFPDSIEEASRQAGFKVYVPSSYLPDLTLIGARYDEELETVVLLFKGEGYNLFLSQRPSGAGPEFFSIGASAVVESVTIGDIQGEFVSGGWANLSNTTTPSVDDSLDLLAQWDNSLPQYTLRWQSELFSFQLRSTGSTSPQKIDLIDLAQSIH